MTYPVTRLGDYCTGHGCHGSRQNITASENVFVNNKKVHRVGDYWTIHTCHNDTHAGITISGSETVFVNGRPIARVGDSVNCGSKIMSGSDNVYSG